MNDTTTKRTYHKKPSYNVYKPLPKDDGGAAFQFTFDQDKRAIFLEAAKQRGPKLPIGAKEQFDWASKIVFKIGVVDIGKLLPLFNGRTDVVKLVHSQEAGKVSSLEIKLGNEYKGQPTFSMQLSKTENGATRRAGLFLSVDELGLIAHFSREALTRMFGFEDRTSWDGSSNASR